MATQEEQKATLQTARLRPLPTPSSRAGRVDAQDLDAKRQAALFSARLQSAVGRRWQAEAMRQAVEEDAPSANPAHAGLEGLAQDDYAIPKGIRGRMVLRLEQTIARRQIEQGQQASEYAPSADEAQQQREEIKKTAKAAMKRGAIFVAQFLLGAIGIGTAGIMFVVNIFFYAVTLGWLNLEMIYGKHLAKGKSRFISPISWAPIPMPIDKDAWILQGAIVAADVALGVVFVALSFFGYCFVHDFTKFAGSPFKAGAALAQGGGDLCLGAIIPGIFGL